MEIQYDRRRWLREVLNPPEVAVLYTNNKGFVPGTHVTKQPSTLFVDLLNRSMGGAIIRTKWTIQPETAFLIGIYSIMDNTWQLVQVKAKWIGRDTQNPNYNIIGVEFQMQNQKIELPDVEKSNVEKIPLPSDYEFLRNTRFLKSIHRDVVCPLLNSLVCWQIKAGERFMLQGSKNDNWFIISQGSCIARIEKNGNLLPVGRYFKGDSLGETAIITDEPCNVNVDAETDMTLWRLTRAQFDRIMVEHAQLRSLLTELVTERLSSSNLPLDRRIGNYFITDIIGHGKYSISYKGVHAQLGMPVAIKMIKHNLAMDPNFMQVFRKEASTIASLNHYNIVKLYDIEESFRTFFVVTELVEGETVKTMMERTKTFSLPQVTNILAQTCSGLSYAHRRGIVHRDIRPSNLILRRHDRLQILDFGLHYPIDGKNVDFARMSPYIPPEQIEGGTADEKSDIYSLGLIAYEMLTGKRLFEKYNQETSTETWQTYDIPDPTRIVPGLPEILRRFILKACAKNPEKRYSNAEAALKELDPLVNEYGLKQKLMNEKNRKMTTLFLIYEEQHQLALKQLMEEFSTKVQKLGADLKAANFKDI